MRCRIRFSRFHCVFLFCLIFTVMYFFELINVKKTSRAVNTQVFMLNYSYSTEIHTEIAPERYYRYPLTNGMRVAMDYLNYNTSYYWFMTMKRWFKNIGGAREYSEGSLTCKVEGWEFGPINVNKSEVSFEWLEKNNRHVKRGGYYAPENCRPTQRVAIIVPYRDRRVNLGIFLYHIHKLLRKQMLEYRIFVVEQFGTDKFNKGTLYNIAFLESQRFGSWDCLIFHNVDLIPEDERISYSCYDHPTHLAAAVESFNYRLPYPNIFSGVTALTPNQFRKVNGYSNFYWNWGGEDDDFYYRLESHNITIFRHNSFYARYAVLPHKLNKGGPERKLLLMLSKKRFKKEGLRTTIYRLVKVVKEKLYTHILADVNPLKMKLDIKTLIEKLFDINGDNIAIGFEEFQLGFPRKRNLSIT